MPTMTSFQSEYESRRNFQIQYHDRHDNKAINANILGVKTYGAFTGKILSFFGYASKTDEGIYINRKSFFQHLVEAWCNTHEKEHKCAYRDLINKMAEKINKDSTLDKRMITAEKVEQIFNDCNFKYITVGILGERTPRFEDPL